MDTKTFKKFDTETRKALHRTEKAPDNLKDLDGATPEALRKSSKQLIKKLQGELEELRDEYLKSEK